MISEFERVCTIPFQSIRYLCMLMDTMGTNLYMHLMERGVFMNSSSIETSCHLPYLASSVKTSQKQILQSVRNGIHQWL